MAEDAERDAKRIKEAAKRDAKRIKEAAKRDAERTTRKLTEDPEMQQEWIRQDYLSYGGLTGIGIVWVQPFLVADSLDTSARICVVAFSVAIPLLAALILVNRQETFRQRRTTSWTVAAARSIAMLSAFVGLVAGFWHIHWIAGAGVLGSTLVAVGVHSAGFSKLEFSPEAEAQGASEATEEPPS